eukprot:SM000354S13413  [mRNA]  locus=s354:19165:21305:- [translate_table: standard]
MRAVLHPLTSQSPVVTADFPALGDAKLTSDAGWGCMLRSGQMMLAQALVCHTLGRGWRIDDHDEKDVPLYLAIIQKFVDLPAKESPFSVHNLIAVGQAHGLVAGAWLGPYVLCRVLEALGARSTEGEVDGRDISSRLPFGVYVVAQDAEGKRGGAPMLCIDEARELCSGSGSALEGNEGPGGVLVLVPLVLGPAKVNPRYLPSLSATFTFPQSLGILGGKPGASTYLVGVQQDQVFYLDPHEVQSLSRVSLDSAVEVDTTSYHCSVVRRMPLEAIDPSIALGFYCDSQESLADFCERAEQLAKDSQGAPMFTVGRSQSPRLQRPETPPNDITLPNNEHAGHADDWQIV